MSDSSTIGRKASRTGSKPAMRYSMAFVIVVGCSSTTGLDSNLAFSVTEERPFAPPSAIAEGGRTSITVVGTVTVSEPCRRFRPTLKRNGFNLELHVAASRSVSCCCPGAVVSFDYEATISELDAGTYQLTIRHTDRGIEQLEIVQQIPVT
jgi:hypothetical protein